MISEIILILYLYLYLGGEVTRFPAHGVNNFFYVIQNYVGVHVCDHNLLCVTSTINSAAAEVTKSDMYPYRKGNK